MCIRDSNNRGRFVWLRKADGASVHRTVGTRNMEHEKLKYTYMLKCRDGSLYTGWTTDLDKRVTCHNAGKGEMCIRDSCSLVWKTTKRIIATKMQARQI